MSIQTEITRLQNNIQNTYSVLSTKGAQIPTIKNSDNLAQTAASVPVLTIEQVCNKIYPVGAIYISMTNTNPSTLFGGTWEKIENKFLLSASTTYPVGSSGGEAAHKLTVSELPNHTHNQQMWDAVNNKLQTMGQPSGGLQSSGAKYFGLSEAIGTQTTKNSIATQSTGSGAAHNNMPPYIAVYMWRRTK